MQLGQVYAGRYRLEERLGAGAFGVVYAAFDQGLLQRRVAVKLLRGDTETAQPTEAQAERFISELRLAGALRHPNIAAVYDAGVWEGQLYMVQELVQGVDLGRYLSENGPLAVDFVLSLAARMVDAVATAHEQGVLHRDLKPGNLLVEPDHRIVVVDFGLATSTTGPAGDARSSGTPGYAAPEQVRGSGDARADQFSLGAVIYLMLTGVAPFVGRNLPETLRRTLLGQPDPPSRLRPEIPPGVDRAVMRALSRSPEDRYPDLRAFAEELAQHAAFTGLTSPAERRAALASAVGRGALVVVAGQDPAEWMRALRLPLGVLLGSGSVADEGERRIVTDPRDEVFPSAEAPVLLALGSGEAPLSLVSDGLRAALVTGTLLVLGLPLDHPALRRLLAHLRVWSPSGAVPVFAAAPRWSLDEVRLAERRGVRLIEAPVDALRADLAADLPPPGALDRPVPSRPYKFLSYFEGGDEAIFFGRDVEVARLHARILAWPVALLYGASGAGKTSLIRAALAPRLERAGHRVLMARVFDDPLAEVCRAAGLPVDPPEDRAARLAAFAREGRLAVVFLDQLEELFLRFPRPARERVAAELAEALAQSGGHLRLVLCLRADYLARLAELSGALPLSLEHGLYLESLSSAGARRAIEGPAALVGVAVEPALVDQLLADLSHDGVDPPQLQLVCDALWEARGPGERALTLRAYQALGEARSVLARHLQRTLDGLPPAERARARDVLKALVTTHDTRSVRRVGDIARAAGLPEGEARARLDGLAALRLVRPLEREDGLWYELTHEVLAAEIGRWLSEEDRRIQQVRELLEQGVRGYEQLGLLLSPAQLELVAPFEDRLMLNERERGLIARSRAALSVDRRRVVGVAALALALVLAAVVGGRALWLSQGRFARATEGHLSWFRWGEAEDRTTSIITVYRGRADPWWMDGWLGYPREPYQTDWTLADMAPSARDALRVGVDLPDPERADAWLVAQLGPVAAAREAILAGDLASVGPALRALAADPANGPAEALSLAPSLALGEAAPDPLLQDLLAVAVDWAVALRVPGGGERLSGRVGAQLGLLLNRVSPEVWGPALRGLLADATGPELVGDLLEVAGPPEQVSGLAASLSSRRPANVEAAVRAVSYTGACAWQGEVRALMGGGQRTVPLERLLQPYLDLSAVCGGPEDVPVVEALLAGVMSGEIELEVANDVLRTLYRLNPARARAALRASEGRLHALRQVTVTPWAYLGAREMVEELTPGGAQQLQGRLYLGDPGAVWPAWEFGMGDRADPGRASWLWPLALYRGEALQQRAVDLLGEGGLSVPQAVPLQIIAARRGDAAAAAAVGLGLAGRDLLPLQTALNQLSAMPGPLPADVGGPGRQAALARGVVALRRGEPTDADFLAALRDPDATGLELMLAVEGQRRLWAEGPAGPALEGLRSPFVRVRLAATVALAVREDPLTVDGDPWLARAVQRVRWARAALALDATLRARARAALDGGQPRYGQQLSRLIRRATGTVETFDATLAPDLPAVFPAEIEDESIYLQMLADMRAGIGTSTEWMIAYVPPQRWGRYATEPLLEGRRDSYLLGVLTGQIPAMTVEDP